MAETTKIQWTNHTFNPWIGCSKVSPGCAHCYAEKTYAVKALRVEWGADKPRYLVSESSWKNPLKWDRQAKKEGTRRRVFCASLADWLDDSVPIEWFVRLLRTIRETENLDWLLLTKRPENWEKRMWEAYDYLKQKLLMTDWDDEGPFVYISVRNLFDWVDAWLNGVAPQNVWIGATAEDRIRLHDRAAHLQNIPAVVRFLSCEPLLESIDLTPWLEPNLRDSMPEEAQRSWCPEVTHGIDWVIVGGESGPDARPFNLNWAYQIVQQCQATRTAVFVKQMGSNPCITGDTSRIFPSTHPLQYRDPKGGDPEEWPAGLRLRQFPTPRRIPVALSA